MKGRKFTTCNICYKYFPRRKPHKPESAPSRIKHLNEHREKGEIAGFDRIDLSNYTLFLHYSPSKAAADEERQARQHAKQKRRQ